MPRFTLLYFVSLLSFAGLHSQDYRFGASPVNYFSPSDYGSGSQNWAIAQDTLRGLIYFGNNNGLLEFDGNKWRLYPLDNGTSIRSIFLDIKKGRIYVGGQGDFGYFQPGENDSLAYISLLPKLNEEDQNFADVWRILPFTDLSPYIQFVTYNKIFNLKPDDTFEKSIEPSMGSLFEFGFSCRGKKYVFEQNKGLLELKGEALTQVKGDPSFLKLNPAFILPYGDGEEMLVGTQSSDTALYLYNGERALLFGSVRNQIPLKDKHLYCGAQLNDTLYAFGTRQFGIYLMNAAGEWLEQINRETRLDNDNILSISTDEGGNLWAGLGHGIALMETNSPLKLVSLESRWRAQGYGSAFFGGKLFLATENGLFVHDTASLNEPSGAVVFSRISDPFREAWALDTLEGELLIGRHEGAFSLDNGYPKQISKELGAWRFRKLPKHPGYMIGGNYLGLSIYRKNTKGRWEWVRKINGFKESARLIEVDANEVIWVSHIYKGVYKIKLDEDLENATVSLYGKQKGFPSNNFINVFKINGDIVFAAENGMYYYDPVADTMKVHPYWNEKFGKSKRINKLIQDKTGNLWCVVDGQLRFFNANGDEETEFQYRKLYGMLGENFEYLHPLNNHQILIGVKQGFVLFQKGYQKTKSYSFRTLIREVYSLSEERIISGGNFHADSSGFIVEQPKTDFEIFKRRENSIRFNYAAPYFEGMKNIQYQCTLVGFKNDTTAWSPETQKEYTNLQPGEYEFKVWAKNDFGEISESGNYRFKVDWAWTDSFTSPWIIGLLLVLFGYGFYQKWKSRKQEAELVKQRETLKRRELELKEKDLENKRLDQERLQQKLELEKKNYENKQQKLEIEAAALTIKQKEQERIQQELEFASIILTQIFHTPKTLQEAIKQLEQIYKSGSFVKLNEVIARLKEHQQELEERQKQLNILSFKWVQCLYRKYNLTERDAEYCFYASLGITIKEIAVKMGGITEEAVRFKLYLIRKDKLKLKKGKGVLRNFIAKFKANPPC